MQLFADIALEHAYLQKGYVTVPLLSGAEVKQLSESYFSNFPETEGKFHTSIELTDVVHRSSVSKQVIAALEHKVKQLMPGYRAVFGGFANKPPAKAGIVRMHSDWQYVDETQYPSFLVWVPLLDVNGQNGALRAIEGSHKHVTLLRGQNTLNPYDAIKDKLSAADVKTIAQPAGEAFILDHRLIHGSGENLTTEPRLAITMTIVPENAELVHYYRDPANDDIQQISKYVVTDEFYTNYDLNGPPAERYKVADVIDDQVQPTVNALLSSLSKQDGLMFDDMMKTSDGSRRIMLDDQDEAELDEEGYIIRPFLSEAEVKELLELFDPKTAGIDLPMAPTTWSKNKQYREHIYAEIKRTFLPKLEKVLDSYRPLSGAFIIKNPGSNSALTTHFDWLFVDERKYASIHVWVPLVDVTEHNGAFRILPKSHKMVHAWRGQNTPDSIFFNDRRIKDGALRTLDMKAGQALLYDNRLIHGTPPNLSDNPRLAAGLVLIPNDATPIHVYTPENKMFDEDVEVYEVDELFYSDHDIKQRPQGYKYLGKVKDTMRAETFKQLEDAFLEPLEEVGEEHKEPELEATHTETSFFSRLKRVFSL